MTDADLRPVILVVIGAGASYNVRPDGTIPGSWYSNHLGRALSCNELRPPLTSQLVKANEFRNTLINRYEACSPIIDKLRVPANQDDATDTLEARLQQYATDYGGDPDGTRHLNAFRYYLRDQLWESTLCMRSVEAGGVTTHFTTLVRILSEFIRKNIRVCVVNFNYDMLFEHACSVQFATFDAWSMDGYISDSDFAVLKPHGSVQWAWPSKQGRHSPHTSAVVERR